ncbi:MAG: AMP-dependent synthetase/ligase [Dermatophilus congolensis]|nr:AMP-dependent synthetase/ligase [Dermatophilus congolensis]
MREIVIPPMGRLPFDDIGSIVPVGTSEDPNRVIFEVRDPRDAQADWVPMTHAEFAAKVGGLAKGFIASGVRPGDRVGIMSRTRFEWTLTDFALWTAGAVPVPVYETSSPNQIAWILSDSGAVGIVVESSEHATATESVRGQLPDLREVWQIDAGDLDRLAESGREVSDDDLARATEHIDRDTIATIIYTSGTTGRPKGCEITHGNFIGLTESILGGVSEVVYADGAALVLFLPLAHVLARIIEVAVVAARVRVGHSPDVTNLMSDLQSFKPTFLLGVPRVFEKVYNATDAKTATEGKGRIFTQATRVAIAYSRAIDTGGPSLVLRAQHALFDKLVYRKLRDAMGGRVQWAVCGGAPLGERLGHFFRGIGVTIIEGYGLTETTAPTNVCTPKLTKIGTVGRPLGGVGIRIADDGEILAKGVGIFKGYHGNPEATAEVFTEDGWLKTGDLGSLDSDGCLTITGRKKEILVTAGGKNVSPAPLEDSIRSHPLVSQCLVVGDGRPFVSALVTLDTEMLPVWAKAHQREDLTPESALTDPFVRERLQLAVDRANQGVSRAESVRKFVIVPGDFTEENGMLTPSMKVKRNVVTQELASRIDDIYGGPIDTE